MASTKMWLTTTRCTVMLWAVVAGLCEMLSVLNNYLLMWNDDVALCVMSAVCSLEWLVYWSTENWSSWCIGMWMSFSSQNVSFLLLIAVLIVPSLVSWLDNKHSCALHCVQKKHPLTFSLISPWISCGFKQKLQWIYPRIERFWQCKN